MDLSGVAEVVLLWRAVRVSTSRRLAFGMALARLGWMRLWWRGGGAMAAARARAWLLIGLSEPVGACSSA